MALRGVVLALFVAVAAASTLPPPAFAGGKALRAADASTSFNELHSPAFDELRTIEGPSDWGEADLLASAFWGMQLTEADLLELDAALAFAKDTAKSGLDIQDGWQPMNMSPERFPLPTLGAKLTAIANELENGRGAAMIKNFPVDRYTLEVVGCSVFERIHHHHHTQKSPPRAPPRPSRARTTRTRTSGSCTRA